jgi:hypothetical protein
VLANLFSNALRYSPAGRPPELHASLSGGTVCLEVADHGPGVPDEQKDRIFEPFERAGDRHPGGGARAHRGARFRRGDGRPDFGGGHARRRADHPGHAAGRPGDQPGSFGPRGHGVMMLGAAGAAGAACAAAVA